jgi:DNA-directed RNA polymerase specialized sigma24 family protein
LPDLLQETRIALWKAGLANGLTAGWIFRTASHKAVDLVRAGIRRRARDRQSPDAIVSSDSPNAELRHLLHARAEELPPHLRRFYELHYEQGFSEREIARSLGLCRASVRWLDHRCLQYIAGAGPARKPAFRRSHPGPAA